MQTLQAHQSYLVEHIRKQIWQQIGSFNNGISSALSAIADIEYHLDQLAQIEANNGLDFGPIGQFSKALEEYHLRVCEVEHALNALLCSLSDYVDSRSREYRVK